MSDYENQADDREAVAALDALYAETQQLEAVVTELTARWKETQDRCASILTAVEDRDTQLRSKIASWVRVTPRAGGVQLSIQSSQDLARVADAIEQKEDEDEDE
jgi:uncharacterized protein YfcZ (UPF0381/DUF406 family)